MINRLPFFHEIVYELGDLTLIIFEQNETHTADYYGLQYDTPIDHGTTHLSTVDKWGGAASVTSTVSSYPSTTKRTQKKKKKV